MPRTPDTPVTPELDPQTAPPTNWTPTRKWVAQLTGSVASILASWIVTGAFDDVERGMAGAALVALTASYWTPDNKTTTV